jgi:hypothetical protein
MIFSGRQYSALNRLYSEMFAPVPQDVLLAAAENGWVPKLGQALYAATQEGLPITVWTPFGLPSRESSEPK